VLNKTKNRTRLSIIEIKSTVSSDQRSPAKLPVIGGQFVYIRVHRTCTVINDSSRVTLARRLIGEIWTNTTASINVRVSRRKSLTKGAARIRYENATIANEKMYAVVNVSRTRKKTDIIITSRRYEIVFKLSSTIRSACVVRFVARAPTR